jgi:amidophosphoribosyltransferase
MISGHGMLAFRDPHGIRPLVYGERKAENGETEYMFASESVALDVLGFENIQDLEPGEIIFVNTKREKFSYIPKVASERCPCIFEYIYFARPDSIIEGSSVYKARVRMGEYLAKKIQRLHPDNDIDVVIPVPESSRPSAMELAVRLGVKFREGFVKNRYIGRTFIMPGQEQRKKSVKQKLNPIPLEFHGKNVLLVDDSIVRGTTSREIIDMARSAGAKKVYFASASPPIRYPNVYGIDMPTKEELVAYNKDEEQIQEEIGADWLVYQDLDDLIKAVTPSDEHPAARVFDCSVFDGNYVTKDIDEAYLNNLKVLRNDKLRNLVDVEMTPDGIDVQEVL